MAVCHQGRTFAAVRQLGLLLFFAFCWLGQNDVQAQQKEKTDSVSVSGRIVDSFTREPVDSVWMEFLTADTLTVVDTLMYLGKHKEKMGVWGEWENDRFTRKLPNYGHYLIRCTKRGWKPLIQPLNIPRKKYNKKVRNWPVDDLLLSRSYYMEATMDEVTVTATRIKMFQNGDTVVFNADAFQLSEGSMLDDLIRQLPGVELKEGGEIYVNGNKVDELLVNGKNFFKGDAKVALENLPAYTVQNVKAYQKAPEDAYLDKHHDKNKKRDPWVIDVGLKREYNTGWIANAEAGYGTDDRYMGRLFVTRYTDHSRITAYANANNVSDLSKPGGEDEWNRSYTPQGQVDALNAGIDFHVDGKKTGNEFDTSVTGSRMKTNNQTETSSTTFLNGGDVFGRSRSRNENTSASVDWNIWMRVKRKQYFSYLWADADYSHSRNNGLSQSATLTADPMDSYRGATLDSLYARQGSARLDSLLTNRSQSLSRGTTTNTRANLNWHQSIVSPLNGERISLDLSGNYDRQHSTDFNQQTTHYNQSTDYRHQYNRQPSRGGGMEMELEHGIWEVKGITLSAVYGYGYTYNRGRRQLYRLDQLPGWGLDDSRPLNLLPSLTDSLSSVIDVRNSYLTINQRHSHDLSIHATKGGEWGYFYVSLPIFGKQRSTIEDTRNGQTKTLTRGFTLWQPMAAFKWKNLDGYYRFGQSAPSMSHLIDVRDDSNPLSISMGNPNLGKTYQNYGQLGYSKNNMKHQSNYRVRASFRQGTQTGNAMTYNRETGVYTYQPRNVKGNWSSSLGYSMTQPLDSAKHWTFRGDMNGGYQRSVDWAMENGEENQNGNEPGLSRVHNYTADGKLQLNYKYKDYSVSANASADYTHQTGSQTYFHTTNTVDFNYGLSASLKLKFGMELATDLTMHSRRGYEDHSMNDNNLVWNAMLSQGFLKRKALIVKLIGHDILGQLSNVRRSVNAQGRTETWYNTQPAYGMLAVSYKFTKQPKRKKKEE